MHSVRLLNALAKVIAQPKELLKGNSMIECFSIIEEVAKKINKPYFWQSLTRFLITENGCYIELTFQAEHVMVEGWVGGALLCLDPKTFSNFAASLRKLTSIHKTGRHVFLQLNPLSREYSEGSYPIFPQIRYGIDDLGVVRIVDKIKGTFDVLCQIKKLLDEFKEYDKSFENLKEVWNRIDCSQDSNEKGRHLEEFFSLLVAKDKNFDMVKTNLRTESEELDIVAENAGITQFYAQLKSPVILFECKNWSSKIGTDEVQKLLKRYKTGLRFYAMSESW